MSAKQRRPTNSTVAISPARRSQIERVAARVRQQWEPDPLKSINLLKAFEELSLQTHCLNDDHFVRVDGGVEELPYPIEALSIHDPSRNRYLVELSESTYEKLCADESRARFTVSHEFGHIFLHHQQLFKRQRLAAALCRFGMAPYPVDDLEREANYFAAVLLIPSEVVSRSDSEPTDTAVIAKRFGVSITTAKWRLSGS